MHRVICAAIIAPNRGTYTYESPLENHPETGSFPTRTYGTVAAVRRVTVGSPRAHR